MAPNKNVMKRYIFYFVVMATLGLFFSNCKKDLRCDYLGEWDFRVERYKDNADFIGQHEHDTIFYTGKIMKGNDDIELIIKYTKDNQLLTTVLDDGTLDDLPTHYCTGMFKNESNIEIYLKWGGLGGGTVHVIDGVKK